MNLFSTLIWVKQHPQPRALNRQLLAEVEVLQDMDEDGRAWSQEHYWGGFTSYSGMNQLHQTSPYFGELATWVEKQSRFFTKQISGSGMDLTVTDMWVNVMPAGTHHSAHIHPVSVISGTYYLQVPPGSAPLVLEDPRIERLMMAPSRPLHHPIPARPGQLVLFESWLRHEVPTHTAKKPRISVSFNLA